MFPLLAKGDRIEFSFLLNETEIQNGRNLRLTIADSGSYVEYIVDEKLSSDKTPDAPESEDVQPDEQSGGGSWSDTLPGSPGSSCGTLDGGIMLLLCAVMILNGRR